MEHYRAKIRLLDALRGEVERLQASGRRVVFTNGCFDILHPGHARYLCAARALGDYLVVGVNSDRSVQAIKGAGRPVVPEDDRAEMLAALDFVDAVVLFDEDDPLRVIQTLRPDVLVKGGDWREEDIAGGDEVRSAGGEVRRIALVPGRSTSAIIERIRSGGEKA
ncbi:MAG: D-glycero-beta-D-manno-heptose 1-phosphate adenylyltransferase [Desulfobacteraceae bacterium]|jgi:D-beta-D-heptose 7-phosphate kinase/D-beta-D-heptose 1-phosphate adenosyltransferase